MSNDEASVPEAEFGSESLVERIFNQIFGSLWTAIGLVGVLFLVAGFLMQTGTLAGLFGMAGLFYLVISVVGYALSWLMRWNIL